ncbi:hypothetical protein GCM10027347_60500 [Larkinella harenae]
MPFQVPRFPDPNDWLAYRPKLIQRLEELIQLHGLVQLPVPFVSSQPDALSPAGLLHLIYDWTKVYGVNPEWLFGMNDEQPALISERPLIQDQIIEFTTICKRLLLMLQNLTRLR